LFIKIILFVLIPGRVKREALKVNILFTYIKLQLMEDTEHSINKYCRKSSKERPLFLQKDISDINNKK
jgi:hypothetical protein